MCSGEVHCCQGRQERHPLRALHPEEGEEVPTVIDTVYWPQIQGKVIAGCGHSAKLVSLQTVDPKFDEMEQKVLSLESLIRTLLRDIGSWQDQLQVRP